MPNSEKRYETMVIANLRISHDETRRENQYMVLHPSTDAVIAYCETLDEANEVVSTITDISDKLEDSIISKRKKNHI